MYNTTVEFLPSYPSLELGENISEDICQLATIIFDSPTACTALLKLPDNLPARSNKDCDGSKVEIIVWEHIRSMSRELLVLDDTPDKWDMGKRLKTMPPTFPPILIVAPIHDRNGGVLGVLCLYDKYKKELSEKQTSGLKVLGKQAGLLGSTIDPLDKKENHGTFVGNKSISIGDYLETNGSVLWSLNKLTGNLWFSNVFFATLGYGEDEISLDSLANWLDMVYFFDQDKVYRKFQAWIENDLLDDELECRLVHKSGDIVFMNLKLLNTKYGKTGTVCELEGDIQDITSQKKVWEQIELIHPQYTSVIQAGYEWLSIVDMKGHYTYSNSSWEFGVGYSSDELIGKDIFSNVHESDRKKVKYYFSKFIKNEPFVSRPFRFQHKSGSWKWLEILMINLNDDPMIQGIVINARDITDRVLINKEIKASEEKHRLLFNSSPYPKYILERESCKIVDVNDAMVEFYGYSRAEFLQMNAKDLRPEEEIGALLKGLNELQLHRGNRNYGIFIHKKRHGELAKMEVVGQLISIDGVQCILATCTNVTEKEEYLNRLRHSEHKLKNATAIAKLGYWSIDLENRSLNCSEEVYRIWDRNPESIKLNLKSIVETIHPNDRKLFAMANKEAFAQHKKFDHVYRIMLPDNSIKWVRQLGQPDLTTGGKPSKFEGTIQDITQQKKEEQQLRLLESVVTNTKDAVLITEAEPLDEAGPKILYANEAFTKMTGYSAKEMIGNTPKILRGPKTDKMELKRLDTALQRWASCEVTIVNYKKNGEEFWVNISISPVADEKGRFTHWISIERDVTVEKNQEILNNLMIDISIVFGHEKYLRQCLHSVLDYLMNFGVFAFTEIWLPNSGNKELKPSGYNVVRAHRQLEDPKHQEATLEHLEELAGIIGENQRIEVRDGKKMKDWDSQKDMSIHGTSCVIGIPLVHNENYVGILFLGTEQELNSHLYYSDPFKEVARYLAAEIKRKQIETELEHVFNFAPDILCKAGKDGYFKKINPAASKLLGYTEEELLSKKILEFVHLEDRNKTRDMQLYVYGGKSYKHFENRYLCKNGETKYLSWTARSSEEEGAVFAVAKDVTEFRELKNILKEVTDLALIGPWELNFNNSTIYWSDMIKKIHEVDQNFTPTIDSVLGFCRDGETREKIVQEINKAIYQGEPWDLEFAIITAKGNERWVRMIGKPEMHLDKCTRIIGSIQDINDLKTAELKMEQANSDKNDILESIGDAFISLDHNWKVTYWNEKAIEVMGIDKGNIMGRDFWGCISKIINPRDYLRYYRSIRAGHTVCFEEYISGLGKWLEVSAYPSENTISLYIRDITEKRQIQSAIERQNEKLREIAWTQSHVVRAPLSRLMGIIELFHENLLEESEKKRMLDHICSSANELDTIIKEIVSKSQSVIALP